MFKRANKITALLVAAASVMSIVPAMAADSTRLGTKDGTIEDAIAYKDGKYAFEGYKTDDNDTSVYFNDGEKDKEINDLSDATIDDTSKYDTSSTIAFDGNDEYLLDLATGKVTDDDVASDLASTAKDKLTTKLEKTDRYGTDATVNNFERITPDQFGDVWYAYEASKQDSTGIKAIVNVDIASAAYTTPSAIEIAGVTFGQPAVATAATYTLVLSDDVAGDYAALTLGGVEITAAATAHAALPAAITAKASALATAGYTVVTAQAGASAGSYTTTLTITKTATGLIDGTVGDLVRLATADTNQVAIATKGSAAVTGYASEADLIEQIKDADLGNFNAVVTKTVAGINVVLTQKYGVNYTAAPGADFTNATATLARAGVTGTGNASGNYHGYTNKSAAYIDADKVANIRVYTGTKMVKLDEFDEDANDDGVTATVVDATTIAQDKDYIYRIIDVDFTGSTATIKNSKGTTVIAAGTTHKYLQKISKAQGETEKDAYLPKTVESYEIDGTISDDADTAATKLATLVSDADKVVGVRVVDGTLYYTEMDDSDTIKTYKLKLQKNEKVEATGASTKVDAYVVKKDGDVDHDLKGDAGKLGASFDIDGNLWIINEGKIYKSEKAGDFTEIFTCDRSIDSLDVYNKESLIAWDASGDVYTTNQEGTKVTEAEATAVAPVVVTGWVQDGANWSFNDATGTKVTNKWVNVGGAWYFLKADGVMATNWYNDNGTWYYLKSSGAMATGWVNDNGTWYYCNASGAMLANTTVDGYVLNASGAWVK